MTARRLHSMHSIATCFSLVTEQTFTPGIQAPKHEAAAPAKQEEVQVGSSIGMAARNPLDLIKSDVPLLSEAKSSQQPRTLSPLIDAAARNEACVWYRVQPDLLTLL